MSQQGGEVVRPAQVFLRLTADGSGDAAYFAATKTKGGGLAVSAAPSAVQKQVWAHVFCSLKALLGPDCGTVTPPAEAACRGAGSALPCASLAKLAAAAEGVPFGRAGCRWAHKGASTLRHCCSGTSLWPLQWSGSW